ncbi:uncharacterized protein Z520_06484 [Fonsecaea multimorphosa CBS 102226]|uniref:Diphthine--ammonia ligase n=1 Tax=Fonsecaea multimorphosa CBS 102226 TaxID=1442371 RepID=A0A0D2IL14_9EURO|nr:uncharacterized protein Z520_06484 [Fonsecaea multimorphosa CBS 102226]KIX97706.1 hypothetical protein Z520_06484 [Fonsecaea multimorphosa CBS 102226]OAL23870.1 hypothetical protein AYO22_06046 [Fonsecaea multimorphosa]
MSDSLNVIALISGGKDSLFSILHCLKNGHKVVALANLYPSTRSVTSGQGHAPSVSPHEGDDSEGEDLNSFMYQTVGHSVIPLYAECLGIPLYRREITGSAVQTGRYYDASALGPSLDETEDLVPLLREVMQAHPKANALCSGAILSTYQRTRVESVAVRLGLTPLAYLWQYPALPPPVGRGESLTGLLDDMRVAGCDARIIKIASGGIKESLLWANVADPKTQLKLINGLQPFFPEHEFWLRGAVLGEGGEYETLAVSGPRGLWRRRIVVAPEHQSTFTGEGGVSYLRLAKPETEANDADPSETLEECLRVPQAFDPQFQAVLTTVEAQETSNVDRSADKLNDQDSKWLKQSLNYTLPPAVCLASGHLALCNITWSNLELDKIPSSAAGQMQGICDQLRSLLESWSRLLGLPTALTPSNIVSTTLLLKDMSNFGAVNLIYASLFRSGEPNPPARVTIACSLPENTEVSLTVIIDLETQEEHRGLHVQSRSYWAPANIGPYSQAICVPVDKQGESQVNVHDAGLVEVVHMAGQISLIPHTMELSQAGFPEQAVLSLQHLWRVGQERGVDMWPWGVAFLASCTDSPVRAELSNRIWQQTHLTGTRPTQSVAGEEGGDGDEGVDAWDLQYNRAATFNAFTSQMTVGQHLHLLPQPGVLLDDGNLPTFLPPFIAVEVVSLPRNAPIEWWSTGITNLPRSPVSKPRVSVGRKEHAWGSIVKVTILPPHGEAGTNIHLVTVLVRREPGMGAVDSAGVETEILDLIQADRDREMPPMAWAEMVHGTAFVALQDQKEWARMIGGPLLKDLAVIPCNSLFGSSGIAANAGSDQGHGRRFGGRAAAVSPLPAESNADMEATAAFCPPLAAAMVMRIDHEQR